MVEGFGDTMVQPPVGCFGDKSTKKSFYTSFYTAFFAEQRFAGSFLRVYVRVLSLILAGRWRVIPCGAGAGGSFRCQRRP